MFLSTFYGVLSIYYLELIIDEGISFNSPNYFKKNTAEFSKIL